jgi:hypothetical protein
MNTLLIHIYIALGIYVLGAIVIGIHLAYLAVKYQFSKSIIKWRRLIVLDALSWPYYVVRYGFEGFYKEIR